MTAAAQPRYLRVNEKDNVAIVVNQGGLAAGSRFACGLTLIEAVPEAHKVALTEIAQDEPIVRYGVIIGRAKQPIARGSWVHDGIVATPAAPSLDNLPLATAVPPPLPKLDGYTFAGYRNADSSVGTTTIRV